MAATDSYAGGDGRLSPLSTPSATRAVLEASLPQLAAALHANGLTLSGGGVSDGGGRARSDAFDDARGKAAARGGAADADPQATAAAPRAALRRRGLVDLTA